ncbi:MAG: cell division FtsA domain-containing protein [Clostridia bacterium]|nr:cell division FtsA domain-containing protein [Clostridia bacterium]
MTKKIAVVLDIGSSKLELMAGAQGLNNTFAVYGKYSHSYSGFSDGEFFEEEKLESIIANLIENFEAKFQLKIKELTVSVPSEFCISKNKKITITFAKTKKLTKALIDKIYSNAGEQINDYSLIHVSPIYNVLDNDIKAIDLDDSLKTSKLTCYVSTIYAQNNLLKNMNNILSNLGVLKVNYVSSAFCEALYLINPKTIENNVMLIDIGYLTTSVAVIRGKGLTLLNSFSMGGGHIMGDLAGRIKLTVKQAEILKRKIVLSLNPATYDCYEVKESNENIKKVNVIMANQIVIDRLNMFASLILKCIDACHSENSSEEKNMPIYLTGGGISYIKGAKEYLSTLLNCKIELLAPPLVEFNKPTDSSVIAVLDFAI